VLLRHILEMPPHGQVGIDLHLGQKPNDEGMTNRPSIFAYLVFTPGEVVVGEATRPVRAMTGYGPRAVLGVQARVRGVQFVLVFG
jgi:hypothetical protein